MRSPNGGPSVGAVAALHAIAIPDAWIEGFSSAAPESRGEVLPERPRGELPSTLGVLDTALNAIGSPAFIVGRSGEILHTNADAVALLAREPRRLRRSLADTVRGAPSQFAWELTPLQEAGRRAAFLAILRVLPPGLPIAEPCCAAPPVWRLTARQEQVAALVARGQTNAGIAQTLGIAEGTVEYHVSGIFDRAGVDNRASLIARMAELRRP